MRRYVCAALIVLSSLSLGGCIRIGAACQIHEISPVHRTCHH